jgi:ketosteroid isomerase-like protein
MKSFMVLLFLVCLLAASVSSKDKKSTSVVNQVADAERAFAKTSVEKGIRDSFIEFFAEDGINFTPHPTKTKENLSKRPATRSPFALNWQPIFADASQAGDLGFTTGPYTLTDTRPNPQPTGHGYYFSFWRKQADSSWKVVIDFGIQTPDPKTTTYTFAPAPASAFKKANANLEAERATLLKADREFIQLASNADASKAYQATMADYGRIHRNGRLPVVGKAAIRAFLAEKAMTIKGEPMFADVAASADLGYTYGKFEWQDKGAAQVTKGYYVRAWKRDVKGTWKIVIDVANELPKD